MNPARPRPPLPPPYMYDEVPPGWPADLPPPITWPGRPRRHFLPRAVCASFPPLKRTWLMLLGLPLRFWADKSVERVIAEFASLVRIDRSLDLTAGEVTRLVCEVDVVDLSEIPRILEISLTRDPSSPKWEVMLVILRRNSDSEGNNGAGAGEGNGGVPGANGDAEVEASSAPTLRET